MEARGTDAADVRDGAVAIGTLERCWAGTPTTRAELLDGPVVLAADGPVATRPATAALLVALLVWVGAAFELTKRCSCGSYAIEESRPRVTPWLVEVTTAGARTARTTVEEAAKLAAVSFGALLSAFH